MTDDMIFRGVKLQTVKGTQLHTYENKIQKKFEKSLSCLFPEEQGWGRTPTMVGLSGNEDPADSVKSTNIDTDVKAHDINKRYEVQGKCWWCSSALHIYSGGNISAIHIM